MHCKLSSVLSAAKNREDSTNLTKKSTDRASDIINVALLPWQGQAVQGVRSRGSILTALAVWKETK